MKKKILLFILVAVLASGWTAYHLYTKKTPDVVKLKPQVTVTAGKLVDAFDADTLTASQKFVDKIVEVTGTIRRIDTAGALVLGEEGSASEVVAGIDYRHIQELQSLQENNPVTIQGICSGYSKSSGDDLLASLGTTIELRSAGIKNDK